MQNVSRSPSPEVIERSTLTLDTANQDQIESAARAASKYTAEQLIDAASNNGITPQQIVNALDGVSERIHGEERAIVKIRSKEIQNNEEAKLLHSKIIECQKLVSDLKNGVIGRVLFVQKIKEYLHIREDRLQYLALSRDLDNVASEIRQLIIEQIKQPLDRIIGSETGD